MGKPYVTIWERMAIRKTSRANLTEILKIGFGVAPTGIAEILGGVTDAKMLEEPLREAVRGESPDAFVERLPVSV